MRAAILSILALIPASTRAARVLVVMSEPASPPYREALEGLRSDWGQALETAPAERPLPPGPYDVIIALGGRGARRALSAATPVVIALAPSFRARPRQAATVRVALTPSPESFARILSKAGIKRLLALRTAAADTEFIRRAAAAGEQNGIVITDGILSEPADLPRQLRGDGANADAVWLAPDPEAVTPETFAAAREFSRARSIPFFAPTPGLVTNEVRGELAVSFEDCGRRAAIAAKNLLAGRIVDKTVYP